VGKSLAEAIAKITEVGYSQFQCEQTLRGGVNIPGLYYTYHNLNSYHGREISNSLAATPKTALSPTIKPAI
jgi:hypothetical protein